MKTRIFVFAAISVLGFCMNAAAGDFANLNFIGFSTDARYLAFEEYGVHDGSGFPYSNIYVVDVVANRFVSNPVKIRIEKETATERAARAKARLSVAPVLKRYRIVERNTGSLVVSRLMTDLSAYELGESNKDVRKINFAEVVGSMYRKGDYELVLRASEIKVKECEYMDQPVQKFELTLKDNETGKTSILQKDVRMPESRGCPMSYELQYIYLYKDHIAVFINAYHVGFEGPDMRYLVVTGKYR